MGLSTAAMLLPTALKLGFQKFGGSKPSAYEKKLRSMAEMMGTEAFQPATDTRAYQSGKSQLDARDDDNRKAINNQSAVTGATDEAKLATIDSSNKSYNQGLQNLLSYADQVKNQNQQKYLNIIGAQEGARAGRVQQYNQNLNNIMDPLSNAMTAFSMADVFSSKKPSSSGHLAVDRDYNNPNAGFWGGNT